MPVLRLELEASRVLAAALILVHATGAAGALLLVPGAAGGLLAVLLVCLGVAAARGRAFLRAPGAIRRLELSTDRQVDAVLASGGRLQGSARSRCHVGPWWVVLVLDGPRHSLLVVRDMLGEEEFRRLRLWALWGRVPAPTRSGAG